MSSVVSPWMVDVRGEQVKPLIESNAPYIRVEAGPGTGKTFGLVRRVQRILHPKGLNVDGGDVLVVAFNRVIAKQLRAEVADMLQKSGFTGKPPVISTVHSLCLELAHTDVRLLLPHEREAMIYDVLHEYPKLKEEFPRRNQAEQALRDHEAEHKQHPLLWNAVESWLS